MMVPNLKRWIIQPLICFRFVIEGDDVINKSVSFNYERKMNEDVDGKYLSEGAAREWSTVVDISIPPPSFKLVPVSTDLCINLH